LERYDRGLSIKRSGKKTKLGISSRKVVTKEDVRSELPATRDKIREGTIWGLGRRCQKGEALGDPRKGHVKEGMAGLPLETFRGNRNLTIRVQYHWMRGTDGVKGAIWLKGEKDRKRAGRAVHYELDLPTTV